MAKRIEVGMLVRIVDNANMIHGRQYIGHIGKVIQQVKVFPEQHWYVDGAERDRGGARLAFHHENLQPIDSESDDIRETREKGAPSFSKMMEKLKKMMETA